MRFGNVSITDIRIDTEEFKASVMLAPSIRLNATQTYCDKYYQNSVVCPHSMFHEYVLDLLVRRFLQAETNLLIWLKPYFRFEDPRSVDSVRIVSGGVATKQ